MKGYLHARGRRIVNGEGQEVLLTGWGLGNWFVPEGYMWLSDSPRFDRYCRMRQVTEELCGREYSRYFWREWRRRYITRKDLCLLRELGYNSVRIPMNWRLLMAEDRYPTFLEEGFAELDHAIALCGEEKLYALLDLHAAPGGQTGTNIDDCIDDQPRLLLDDESYRRGVMLWEEIASRYANNPWVGAYDLLNEPIAPPSNGKNHDDLLPRLKQFYRDATAAIRKYDNHHLIAYEGHHWATDTAALEECYDPNMVLHFHRYACVPDIRAYDEFIELSQKLDKPLWLGETGENLNYWYAAMYPLALSLGIGYSLWPYKKMACTNSPISFDAPEGWDEVLAYTKGGPRPAYERAIAIFDKLLENICFENCTRHDEVTNHVFRKGCFEMRASDFDREGHSGGVEMHNEYGYRDDSGMRLCAREPEGTPRFFFDCQCDRFDLLLSEGMTVRYTLGATRRVMFTGRGRLLVNGQSLNIGEWFETKGSSQLTVTALDNAELMTLIAEG